MSASVPPVRSAAAATLAGGPESGQVARPRPGRRRL